MNRWKRSPNALFSIAFNVLLTGTLATIAVQTQAQAPESQVLAPGQPGVRQFPKAAERGTLVVTAPPEARLNGRADRLSPGARIRDPNNILVMSGAVVGQTLTVNYTRNAGGLIHEVWILNADEAREKRAGAAPTRNFVFSSEADVAPRDDGKTPFDKLPKYPRQ